MSNGILRLSLQWAICWEGFSSLQILQYIDSILGKAQWQQTIFIESNRIKLFHFIRTELKEGSMDSGAQNWN